MKTGSWSQIFNIAKGRHSKLQNEALDVNYSKKLVKSRGRHKKNWSEPGTFWVPPLNPEPPGTHFFGSYLEPGTPEPMGSWVPHMPTPGQEVIQGQKLQKSVENVQKVDFCHFHDVISRNR